MATADNISRPPSMESKRRLVEGATSHILQEILQRGFHGKGLIEISVQDGCISHVRRVVERIEK